MRRKHQTLAGMAVVSSLSLMASPAAATDGLLFSADGENWRPSFSEPLFVGAVIVPGDQVSRSFWLRNGSEHNADLTIAIRGSEFSATTAPESLWVTAAIAEQAPKPATGAQDRVILAMPSMGESTSQKVTVTVGLSKEARNVTQERSVPVQFEVMLTESVPSGDRGRDVPLAEARPVPALEAPLANTGFTAAWLAASATSLMVGGGLAVIRNRRRSRATGGVSNGAA